MCECVGVYVGVERGRTSQRASERVHIGIRVRFESAYSHTPNHVVLQPATAGWLQLATAGSSHSTPAPSTPHTHTRTYDILRSHLRCSSRHFLHVVLGLGRGRRSQRCNLCVCEWGRGGGWAVRWAVERVCAHQSSNETHDPSSSCATKVYVSDGD